MRASPRRQLSYAGLFGLLALDLAALTSFLIVQLLGAPIAIAWVAGAVLTGMAWPAMLRWTDKVFGLRSNSRTIPLTGESFL